MSVTSTTNEEGVRLIEIGDEISGVSLAVIPAGETAPLSIEVTPIGAAAVCEGSIRLDAGLAASLASQLYAALTG